MPVHKSITELIGDVPLVELTNYQRARGLSATIIGMLEYLNPAGSNKDRIALGMIEDAERAGKIDADTVIIEPTSGNTGIGLAAVCAARRYRLILTMPETMSLERRKLLKAYGAELVLTSGSKGMPGAIERAFELAQEYPNSFIPNQFSNPSNPALHEVSTGPEIWEATAGEVDIFVAGVGTGGTVTGVGRYLKRLKPSVYVVAVEPADSAVLSGGSAGPHNVQGIGPGFVPDTLDTTVYDEVIAVTEDDAFATARELAYTDGILAGVSSGATLWAATQLALRPEHAGKTIVVVILDAGERYLSTKLFSE